MRPQSAPLRLEELEARLLLKAPSDAPLLGPPPAPSASVIWVATETQLQDAVNNLQSGQTIVLQKGTYTLTHDLNLGINQQLSNITLRGETDNFDDVVIRGQGMDNPAIGMGISVYNAQNVTIANLSVGDTYFHAIQLQGSAGAAGVHLYHDHLFDTGEQLIKSNPSSAGTGANNCIVEYNLIEYTNGPSTVDHGPGAGYTDGISAHGVDGWIIRNNLFRNFHTPDTSTWAYNPVVLVWNHSSNTVVDGNTFINVDRAIALGLIDQATGYDHQGGVISNNMVYLQPGLASATRIAGSDGQILVYDSPGTKVYHNTLLINGNSNKSIEVRFASAGVEVRNNLADAPLSSRDGATFDASGNDLNASAGMFVDPASGNLHLLSNSLTQATVIDQATPLAGVTHDWDGDPRPIGTAADIGADEFQDGTLPPPVPAHLRDVALVFTHSPEYDHNLVTQVYERYLGREPEPEGLASWVSALQQGLSDERLEAAFLSSAEYIHNHGGIGPAWILGLYQDLLGRTPADGEVQNWETVLNAGTPASAVALGFAASPEREALRVADLYQTYLGRAAAPSEIDAWVNAFLNGASSEDIAAGFVGSPEYFEQANKGQGNVAAWIASVYQDVLQRSASSAEINAWEMILNNA